MILSCDVLWVVIVLLSDYNVCSFVAKSEGPRPVIVSRSRAGFTLNIIDTPGLIEGGYINDMALDIIKRYMLNCLCLTCNTSPVKHVFGLKKVIYCVCPFYLPLFPPLFCGNMCLFE